MRRGRRSSAPPAATSERLTSGMPSLAPRAATIRSQASAISKPPATAKPSIAAISGLGDARGAARPEPPSAAPRRRPAPHASRALAGRAVAEPLAADGATARLHGGDPERPAATAGAIGADRVRTFRADLSSLEEVRALADEVTRSTDELHVLINNAGIGTGRPDLTT